MEAKINEDEKSPQILGRNIGELGELSGVEEVKKSDDISPTKKSFVWQFFNHNKTTNELKCKINGCGQVLKYNGNTSVMRDHIEAFHPGEFKKLKKEKDSQIYIDAPQLKMIKLSSVKEYQITYSLGSFILKELKPFDMLYSNSFKELMQLLEPRYTIPARETFMQKTVPEIYNDYKKKLVGQLSQIAGYALTFDFWSSFCEKSFLTITIHFVNDLYENKSFVAKTIQFSLQHSDENIAEAVDNAISEFLGENHNSIIERFAVTDGAKNMINTAKKLSFPRIQCFAHFLHNSLLTGISEANLSDIITKLHQLASIIRRSPQISERFSTLQKNLNNYKKKIKIDIETRWNSKYIMIKRFIKNKIVVVTLLCEEFQKLKDIKISEEEWKCISALKDILKPFYKMTKKVCESATSISAILPMLHNSYENILLIKENDSEPACKLKIAIKKSLKDHEKIYSEVKDILNLTCFLDPRFKKLPFIDSENYTNVQKIIDELVKKYEKLFKEKGLLSDSPIIEYEKKRLKKEKPSEESIIFGTSYYKSETIEKLELDEYKAIPPIHLEMSPLIWWKENAKNFKTLSMLAKIFLCIPASEQLFSKAGYLLNYRRTSLSSKAVDHYLFVSSNYKKFNS